MPKPLLIGDPAPWFRGEMLHGPASLAFDPFGGKLVVMLLLGDATWPNAAPALDVLARHRDIFDDVGACLFGVSISARNADEGLITSQRSGIRWYLDRDRSISERFGAIDTNDDGQIIYRSHWLLLDPMLRVMHAATIDKGDEIMAAARAWLAQDNEAIAAPVLVVPRVFEPELCRQLIERYEREGGVDSGTMREENGRTVGRIDHRQKKRADCLITDQETMDQLAARLHRFLVPQIQRCFQFTPTRIERFLVSCYDDLDGGGHFRPHRDNTTSGTAHRNFACTINLNAEDYDGGDLSFPEFGQKTYRAPTGGAIVFSCSLMHGVNRVTRGKRYAFLPFFYDNTGHDLRQANLHLLDAEMQGTA